jgi:hypothetical protein
MQGLDEKAVLKLILDKQERKFWIGMGLEGTVVRIIAQLCVLETTLRKGARFDRCKFLEC